MLPDAVLKIADPYAIAVYAVLASHADRLTWECWPSAETIAAASGISRAAAFRALKKLEEHGCIVREKRSNSAGKVPSRYTLTATINTVSGSEGSLSVIRGSLSQRPSGGDSLTQRQGSLSQTHKLESVNKNSLSSEEDRESQPQKNPPPKIKRATRLPDGWTPDPAIADPFAFSTETLVRELDKFRDYYTAHGKTMVDWSAAWRNWLRKASEYAPRPSSNGRSDKWTPERLAAYAVELERQGL